MVHFSDVITAVDTQMQTQMNEILATVEEGNEHLEQITTLLQHVNKHAKDGVLDLKDHPEVLELLESIRAHHPDLIDKDISYWSKDELNAFKQNINHSIKKIENKQKHEMDIAGYHMGKHKSIYEILLETLKRLN